MEFWQFFGNLLLPLFMVATLCIIFQVRPEPVLSAIIGGIALTLRYAFLTLDIGIRALYELCRKLISNKDPRPLPRRKPF